MLKKSEAIAEMIAAGLVFERFASTAIENMRTLVRRSGGARLLKPVLRACLEMQLEDGAPVGESPEEIADHVSGLAAFLVLSFGRKAVEKAVMAEADGSRIENQAGLLLLARLLDLVEEPPPHPELSPAYEPALEALVKAFEECPHVLPHVLPLLECFPGLPSHWLAERVLEAGRDHPNAHFFAKALVLSGLSVQTRHAGLSWLIAKGGDDGRRFLAALSAGDVGADLAAELPALVAPAKASARSGASKAERDAQFSRAWPVVGAYATMMDGIGSQAVYIVRKFGRRNAFCGVVFNEMRGLADMTAVSGLSDKEVDQLLEDYVEAGPELFDVHPGYAMGRIRVAIAISQRQQIPLPQVFNANRYLLAGLWDLPAVDAWSSLAEAAEPSRDATTADLLDDESFDSWFLSGNESPETEEFLHQAVKSMDASWEGEPGDPRLLALASGWAERVVGPVRDRLADRLAQAAYLFDRGSSSKERDLAAAAARDLRSSSGLTLGRQPFVAAFLERSAIQAFEEGWE